MAATMRTPHAAPRFIYAPATPTSSPHGRARARRAGGTAKGVSHEARAPGPAQDDGLRPRWNTAGRVRRGRDPLRPGQDPLGGLARHRRTYLLRTARMTAAPSGAAVTPP